MTESVFGNLDMDAVPDDPFLIEEGWYRCTCTAVDVSFNDEGDLNLVIKWTIDDPEVKYNGFPIWDKFFGLDFNTPFADQDFRQQINLSSLKKRMRRAFDFSESEVKSFSDWDQFIGAEARVKVTHGTSKKENDDRTFVNVNDAMSNRLWNEKYGDIDESLGL